MKDIKKPKKVKAKVETTVSLAEKRKEYEEVVGKKPFNGWDVDTLEEKIAFEKYIYRRIEQIDGDKNELSQLFYQLYANPVINKKKAIAKEKLDDLEV